MLSETIYCNLQRVLFVLFVLTSVYVQYVTLQCFVFVDVYYYNFNEKKKKELLKKIIKIKELKKKLLFCLSTKKEKVHK